MHTYEVEIKSLLGEEKAADALRAKLQARDGLTVKGSHSQRNHYFNAPEDVARLEELLLPHVPEEKHQSLKKILEEGTNHSIRTRDADDTVLIVVKASVGDDTSANGVSRIEFESEVPLSLEALDGLLLNAGLTYQAKWSRDREEYELAREGMNITIDRNAGYGYLAEFEKVVASEDAIHTAREEIERFMEELGVSELPQDRLERMFAYYNEHWEEYYGTDKTFTIA